MNGIPLQFYAWYLITLLCMVFHHDFMDGIPTWFYEWYSITILWMVFHHDFMHVISSCYNLLWGVLFFSGTTYSCVGMYQAVTGVIDILEVEDGHRCIPSVVAFRYCSALHSQQWAKQNTTIWNRMRPRALVQNQQTRELISAWKTSHTDAATKTWVADGSSHLACE